MRTGLCVFTILIASWQPETDSMPAASLPLGQETTQQVKVGMRVSAGQGNCVGIVGTVPIPIEWPEQKVRVVEENFSPFVQDVKYRMVAGTVQQMVVNIPSLPAGEVAEAIVTLEVTRSTILPPEDPTVFVIPKKLPREVRVYLGSSPGIETRNAKIKSLAKEITKDIESPWDKAEAIYDWVRENVKYEDGKFKGALAALKDQTGDCEELSSLFIALCRASEIPARTVWVPDHCYPEFYLEDADGNGFWLPCQAAGDRAFGEIAETRPILQKGDNFKVPERKDLQRYVSEHLTGKGGTPKVKFIREALPAEPPAAAQP